MINKKYHHSTYTLFLLDDPRILSNADHSKLLVLTMGNIMSRRPKNLRMQSMHKRQVKKKERSYDI